MKVLKDTDLMDYYIKKYKISRFFVKYKRKYFELHHFDKNENIYCAGKKLDYLYFLVEGSANIFSNLKDGKQMLISHIRPFHTIGEVELSREGLIRFDIVAQEKSILIALPYKVIVDYLETDYKFWNFTLKSVAEKLETTSEFLLMGTLYPLDIRLSNYLYKSADSEDKVHFSSLTEFANMFVVSYRQLLRVINKMKENEIIEKYDKHFYIKNKAYLESLLMSI